MFSRILVAGLVLTAGAFAQTSSFPKRDYFREVFKQNNTKVDLRDPVRLKDFVVDGKLTLSLKDYIDLVMANNTQIQVQFLTLETPKNNITSVYGKWDPTATASFTTTRSSSYQNLAISKSLNQPFALGYSQTLDTGTIYSIGFTTTKSSSSVLSAFGYNPGIASGLSFQVTQPLIQNRGRYVNRIPLMQAESTYKQSGISLRTQLLNLVNTAEGAYWNLIQARESLRVAKQNYDNNKTNYDFVMKQLSLGAVPELDTYNSEGQLASAEVSVSQAEFSLAKAEDALRTQISVDLDPDIRKLPIELSEPIEISTDSLSLDSEAEVQKGLNTNPAVQLAVERLSFDELGIQSAHNGLLPNLSFAAKYSAAGQGGIYGTGGTEVPGGLGDALSQMFGFGYPTYQGSLTLTLPIRNRTASMTMANSLVTKKNDTLGLRNVQQQTRLSVLNAVTGVKGAIDQLKLAKKEVEIEQKNLDAQNLEYQLGTNTNQDVVLALEALSSAQAQLATSEVGVRTAILTLYTQTGELLDVHNIVVK